MLKVIRYTQDIIFIFISPKRLQENKKRNIKLLNKQQKSLLCSRTRVDLINAFNAQYKWTGFWSSVYRPTIKHQALVLVANKRVDISHRCLYNSKIAYQIKYSWRFANAVYFNEAFRPYSSRKSSPSSEVLTYLDSTPQLIQWKRIASREWNVSGLKNFIHKTWHQI